MSTYLYRARDRHGCLLYVGIADDVERRLRQHAAAAAWAAECARLDVDEYPSRADAARAERRAIADERPLHNVAGAPRAHRRRRWKQGTLPLRGGSPWENTDETRLRVLAGRALGRPHRSLELALRLGRFPDWWEVLADMVAESPVEAGEQS